MLLLLLFLLLFQFFDHLLQLGDDLLFLVADDLPGPGQIEPAADIVHQAGDFVERIDLQRLDVGFHQLGERDVAARQLRFVLQELADRLQAVVLLQQPVMATA